LLLALRGYVTLCISPAVLDEYEEVLRRPRFKLSPERIDKTLAAIRRTAELVEPTNTLAISSHESDNRLLECAGAARADYLMTGNARHFPLFYKTTKILSGRQFLDIMAAPEIE
jgi:putative PIN family toxin of toxin-antitoxin system